VPLFCLHTIAYLIFTQAEPKLLPLYSEILKGRGPTYGISSVPFARVPSMPEELNSKSLLSNMPPAAQNSLLPRGLVFIRLLLMPR
jgi:hypothetical protein